MDNHTPGPWEAIEEGEANRYAVLGPDGDWLLTVLHNGQQLSSKQIANFRLIAAAPELLEALRGLLNAPDPDEVEDHAPRFRAVMNAHAAIAKATGGAR